MAELTDMQARFVAALTSTPGFIGNVTKSAVEAGYSEKSAHEIGRQLLEKSHVRDAIDEALRGQITGPLATKAVDILREIINDPTVPLKLRLEAAKTVLDRSGIITPRAAEQKPPGQANDLASMSMEELETFIRQGQISLAQGRAPGADLAVVSG